MKACKQLHHVNGIIFILDNCDKLLTANSLHLISALKSHIIVCSKDWADAIVSQINNIAISTSHASKARYLVLVQDCKSR